jgi:hypothetical protein
MTETEDQRAKQAAVAVEEDLPAFVYDPSAKVIRALLENRNLREKDVLIIASRKNLSGDILDSIFRDKRWAESYPVRLALARNPKTPLFAALSIARFLRLFDLVELTRSHALPVIYRRKLEALVSEKIPGMALGAKKTLAKIASGEVLMKLIQDGYPEVVKICLDNPALTEAHLYKIISRQTTAPGTIRTIAEHGNWPIRYHIKIALVRNDQSPLARTVLFLPDLRTGSLKELYRDPSLPPGIRPFIHRELMERGEDPEKLSLPEEEKIYEIEDSEMEDVEQEMNAPESAGSGLTQPVADEQPSRDNEDPCA